MNKLIGAASIILDDENKILLVKHSYGKCNWELPGGKSEEKESAEETAVREVYEEIGLNVEIGRLMGIYYDPHYDMHHFVFLAKNEDTNRTPRPSSPEILECGFFPIDDLPRPISDFTYQRIMNSLNSNETVFKVIGPRQWME
ncbi:NUDIX domain-containing protein [Paenibacillus sp. HJL G12]|uniref:NUDIX domain-containing protein n=1 Tax=Paenibacillus dendrobii TaxID=2691084 RepID=A0A7X3IG86_9BACL|nr:NUDIX hydrolase [Paenibacillus dendrobii]MWV43364.1 NUDIX domain-containing protein [Paenibacillus dendrobii]